MAATGYIRPGRVEITIVVTGPNPERPAAQRTIKLDLDRAQLARAPGELVRFVATELVRVIEGAQAQSQFTPPPRAPGC